MILFLYGSDSFRSKRKLDEIVAKFRLEHDRSGMNTVSLDAGTVERGDLQSALAAAPFLGSRRMVIIRGALALKKADQEAIVPLIAGLPESTAAVFREREEAVACKKSPLWDALTAGKFHWEFAPLGGAKLAAWVAGEAQTRGLTFEQDALDAFREAVGSDSARAANELDKIAAYLGDRKRILRSDVAELVAGEAREDLFGFLDAVAAKQAGRAATLLETQIAAGTEPLQLIAMLARSVRLLLMGRDLLDRGVPQDAAIATLGVHPFAARKSIAQARSFDLPTLRALHAAVMRAERGIKTGAVPSPRVALDLLVAKALV